VKPDIPMLDLNRPADVADFILKFLLHSPAQLRAAGT
jgi:hypothetical protein